MRWLPHFLTLLRLLASPLLVWLLLGSRFRTSLAVALAAGLTDWFDGFTARRLGVTGRLGIVFDPIADKVLLVTLFLVLGFLRLIPIWMLLLAIGRDVVILGGSLLLVWFRGIRQFLPSALGKISTFFQVVLVVLVLLHASFPQPAWVLLEEIALAASALFTGVSGLDYVRRGIRLARKAPA